MTTEAMQGHTPREAFEAGYSKWCKAVESWGNTTNDDPNMPLLGDFVTVEIEALLSHHADDMVKALRVAERWLANCVPTSVLSGPKPLPLVRAAIERATQKESVK